METQLIDIGGIMVSPGLALIGAALFVGLCLTVLIFVTLRINRQRLEEAAQVATEALRSNFIQQIGERDSRLQASDARLHEKMQENARLQADVAALKAQMGEQVKQAEAGLKRFEGAQKQMTEQFKAIAGEVLQQHGETFSKQNREQVDTLLKPLNDKIVEFQSGLLRDRAVMGEQIRALAESNLRITTEAHNLTRALKGNAQTQGAWGEMILATILERSGLSEGDQYRTQQSHTGEDGGRVRTDVEILMPNDDILVIDSKVSLTAFEAFTNTDEDGERAQHLSAHLASIRTHIKTLGEKNYQRHAGSSLDFVMMFVPIESALSTAIGADARLIEYALSQGVMLTTPTTLMTVLRTVRNVWDIDKRHENAEEIAKRAGALYDKVAGFISTLDGLGKHLDRAQASFSNARGQLTGRGSVIRQVEMLRELGAKSTKRMPAGWEGEDAGDSIAMAQIESSPPTVDPDIEAAD